MFPYLHSKRENLAGLPNSTSSVDEQSPALRHSMAGTSARKAERLRGGPEQEVQTHTPGRAEAGGQVAPCLGASCSQAQCDGPSTRAGPKCSPERKAISASELG